MIYKLDNPNIAASLFQDWNETMIYSCIEGVMGEIYVLNKTAFESAAATLGDFVFLAGEKDKNLLKSVIENKKYNFMILVPQNDEWSSLIEEYYNDIFEKKFRYALKKKSDIFNIQKLKKAVLSIPKEYKIEAIDEFFYNYCLSESWSCDLVSQFRSYEEYSNLGLGFVALKNREIISGASSYSRYSNGIEIEIDTKPEYRRKGIAYACGAKLILECLNKGLYPSWDAQNKASLFLAEKLGYQFDYKYQVYELKK